MAITDNLQAKIQKAKAAGYTDDQINTFLKSQNVMPPKTDLFSKITDAASKVTDALGLHKAVDTTATNMENIAQPGLMERTHGPETNVFDNMAAGADIGLATAGLDTGAIGVKAAGTAAKTAIKDAATTVAAKGAKLVQQSIPKTVETVLQETPAELFDHYAGLAKNATLNNKNMTPLEFVGTKAQEALDQIQRKLAGIGQDKGAVLAKASVGLKPVGNIAVKFRQELGNAVKGGLAVEGDGSLVQKLLTGAEKLGNNPTAQQVDHFIDGAQDLVYSAGRDLTVPVTSKGTAIARSAIGKLNEALKSQLPQGYRNSNQLFHDLIGVRDELNTKLGAEGEKGGALMKRVFSPSDANTKQLFARIKSITGVDLVNEATLARYVMDVMGDARQKSMLEQLNLLNTKPTPHGVLSKAVEYATSHFNTPEEILSRARQRTIGGASATALPQ